ncbi:unnamed protein product [Calypogeia fissa]
MHAGKLDSKAISDLTAEATLIVATFSEKHDKLCHKDVLKALGAHRDNLCLEGVQWVTAQRDSLKWENKHGLTKYERLAVAEYKAWKIEAKPKSAATTQPNLVRAYMLFKGCSQEEARLKVEKDSKWVDTSDKDESEHDPSELEDSTVEDEELEEVMVENEEPTEETPSGVGAPAVEEATLFGDEELEELMLQNKEPTDTTPTGVGAPDVDEATNLDEFTPTQVLFGHGSFAGITLSQPSPQQENLTTNSGDANMQDQFCIPLSSPEPAHRMHNYHSPTAGQSEMSQIPSFVLPDVETPRSNLFKQFIKTVSPEKTGCTDGGKGNKHEMLVGLFSEFLHHLASPSQEVPLKILESQEVSGAFNTTTPLST